MPTLSDHFVHWAAKSQSGLKKVDVGYPQLDYYIYIGRWLPPTSVLYAPRFRHLQVLRGQLSQLVAHPQSSQCLTSLHHLYCHYFNLCELLSLQFYYFKIQSKTCNGFKVFKYIILLVRLIEVFDRAPLGAEFAYTIIYNL